MKKKILIIEDNEDVRENLAEILKLSNYETLLAENGKIGVELALTHKPDLILCDVMMPELDGFGVLHILSKKPATADVPFIFLTAKADKGDIRKGMNLGADDYITKPFDDVELLDAIEVRLKKSDRLKESFNKSREGLSSFINEARGYEALKELSSERQITSFHKRDVIFAEGSYPRYLYFVNKGRVKLYKTNDYGKEFILSIYREGEFFGHIELLKGEVYAASTMAMEPTELSLVPKEDFFKLVYGNKDVAARMIKILADNVLEQEEQLIQLAYNSIRKRVAEALLHLKERYAVDERGEPISILRDDLAGLVGTAKESVIRTLTDFRKEGLIDIEKGQITILNEEKLRRMPN